MLKANCSRNEAHRRHCRRFLDLAEQAESKLTGPEQMEWLEKLENEIDNIRLVLERSASVWQDAEVGLRLATALWQYWDRRGHRNEGREWLCELRNKSKAVPAKIRANALNAEGMLTYRQGDYTTAHDLHKQSLKLRLELDDEMGVASSLNSLGLTLEALGHFSNARKYYEQSLEKLTVLGNKPRIAKVLNNLGNLAIDQLDYTSARRFYEESLIIRQELGDVGEIALCLANLGLVWEYNEQDYKRAEEMYKRSLEIGDQRTIPTALLNLGSVRKKQGDFAEARIFYKKSLALRLATGDKRGIVYLLEGFASLAAAQYLLERTTRLWGASEIQRESVGCPLRSYIRVEHEQEIAYVEKILGKELFDKGYKEGQNMTMDEAISYALQE